ncbi:hypothetical protein EJ110_NYTH24124 [Nymphaea thermarum]|nr:hypothetical protein EJ110_NYTH24124 [Nymphaea thermarum]
MDRNSFITLCNILKEKNLVEDAPKINIEEQVAIFILTLGHNECNRACQNTFRHSGQTISKYMKLILRALCQLGLFMSYRWHSHTSLSTYIRTIEVS